MKKYNYNFEDVKDTYDNYFFKNDSSGLIVFNKKTGEVSHDIELIDRLIFSTSWVEVVGLTYEVDIKDLSLSDRGFRYYKAFDSDSKTTYNLLMNLMNSQIKNNGYIDSNNIYYLLEKAYRAPYAMNIIEFLLKDEYYLKATDKWVKHSMNMPINDNNKPVILDENIIKKVKSNSRLNLKK